MKTVLITGANSGIGFSCVRAFLNEGYKVYAHYHNQKDNLKSLENDRLILIQADLSQEIETKKIIANIFDDTKTLDVLVNNAAFYKRVSTFDKISVKDFDYTMQVNLHAPFLLSKEYLKYMKSHKKGNIINISSIGVKYGGSPNSIAYTVSKSALETMTVSFAKEAAKYNILVNALRVGVTDTDIHLNADNKNMKKRIEMIPLGRMAFPEEIADYILFLSSDKCCFSTGSILTIAGGE